MAYTMVASVEPEASNAETVQPMVLETSDVEETDQIEASVEPIVSTPNDMQALEVATVDPEEQVAPHVVVRPLPYHTPLFPASYLGL